MINRTPGKVFEGELNAKGLRIGIVCSRFNEFFVGKLLDGAMDAFVRHGGDAADVEVAWVPGSFELPFAVEILHCEFASETLEVGMRGNFYGMVLVRIRVHRNTLISSMHSSGLPFRWRRR